MHYNATLKFAVVALLVALIGLSFKSIQKTLGVVDRKLIDLRRRRNDFFKNSSF